jgi:O-antigen/teichoic acid export membrane protein
MQLCRLRPVDQNLQPISTDAMRRSLLSETARSGPSQLAPTGKTGAPSAEAPSASGGLWSWVRRQAREPYVHLLLAQVCTGATAALANVLMARTLALSGRGLIALLLQVSYLASQLIMLGTQRSFIARYHGRSPAAGVRAYASLVAGPCVAGVAAVGLTAAGLPSHLRPALSLIVLVAAFAVVNVLAQAVRAIAIASGRHPGFLLAAVLGQLFLLTMLTVLFLAGVTQPWVWFLAYVLADLLPMGACAIVWSRASAGDTAPAAGATEHDERRAVRREGLALFPAAVANMGMLRLDRLVLPALASTAALGLYATVSTMTELLAWPLQAYADSRLGRWRAAHGLGRLRALPVILSTAAYAVLVAPVFGVVVYLIIVPLFGQSYVAAKALVLPLVAAAGLYAVSRVTLGVLIGQRRNLLASAAEVCGFVASLVAYVVLIPSHGPLGAAYGSLIGYGACLVFAVAAVSVRGTPAAGRSEPVAGRSEPADLG